VPLTHSFRYEAFVSLDLGLVVVDHLGEGYAQSLGVFDVEGDPFLCQFAAAFYGVLAAGFLPRFGLCPLPCFSGRAATDKAIDLDFGPLAALE